MYRQKLIEILAKHGFTVEENRQGVRLIRNGNPATDFASDLTVITETIMRRCANTTLGKELIEADKDFMAQPLNWQ